MQQRNDRGSVPGGNVWKLTKTSLDQIWDLHESHDGYILVYVGGGDPGRGSDPRRSRLPAQRSAPFLRVMSHPSRTVYACVVGVAVPDAGCETPPGPGEGTSSEPSLRM